MIAVPKPWILKEGEILMKDVEVIKSMVGT